MRVVRCTVDDEPRVVVLRDGGAAMLLGVGDDSGPAALIRAARTRGESLQTLLIERAGAIDDAIDIDYAEGVVRRGGEVFPIRVPVDAPEVWAAGVTYLRSREARLAESGASSQNDYYNRVYEADRPELFLKDASCRRTVGAGDYVAVRGDSTWTVPEPEIGLVLDAEATIVGFTIGNDMSARDVEGENPLYLAQSKTYRNSCALGPAVWLPPAGTSEPEFEITLRIVGADGRVAFEGSSSTASMVRTFRELASRLLLHNHLEDGTVLLTGTGIVPPDDFSLSDGDRVEIAVPEIGLLGNRVRQLNADDHAVSDGAEV